jgi:hypothetical protein
LTLSIKCQSVDFLVYTILAYNNKHSIGITDLL